MEALNSIVEDYVSLLPTCDAQHLQADEWFERRGSQGAEVISAEVQQG